VASPLRIRARLRGARIVWATFERRHRRGVQRAILVAAAFALFAGTSAWYVTSLVRGLPSTETVEQLGSMDQATAVFDREDHLAFTIFKEQRIVVPLHEMSPYLVQAVIAVEDQRFYQHHGFDPIRILSAAIQNLRNGRAVQGGSTITQQLARQSFLTNDKTIRRKLQELILARQLESRFSKDRILELYLNKIYFGDGLYGVEAASRGYFGKHALSLSVDEAALLAGLVQSPSRFSPTSNLARATSRRNVVLRAMLGTGAISRATWETARASRVTLVDGLHAEQPFAEYFKEQIRLALVQQFGWDRVYKEGLRVYSTIDVDMQRAAEDSIADALKSLVPRTAMSVTRANAGPLQAALIAMDPATGDVRAMVGGRNFNESSFNRAVQARRQPGSAFKPLVYAAAIEAGYSASTIIDHLNDPIDTLQGQWTPEEGHAGASALSLRAALRTSSNRAAVRLLEDVGIGRVVSSAKALGVGDMPRVPSLALGSGEVTLASLTAAYSAFANHGIVSQPRLVRRVEDQNGSLLYTAPSTSQRAIKDTTAFLMASLLADVVDAGTAAGVRARGFTFPAGGKTGTTNDFRDAWFVGFTPAVLTGVWLGFDEPRTIMPNGFAAELAVPLWTSFMKQATKGDRPAWFTPPPGIVSARICRLSGKLATDRCDPDTTYVEYFANGTQPDDTCDVHRPRGLVGLLAGLFHESPPPSRIAVAETPPPVLAAVSTVGVDVPPAAAPPPVTTEAPSAPVKKRGFWSKVFGIQKNDKK
jgi:penicillin-binding protein 1A